MTSPQRIGEIFFMRRPFCRERAKVGYDGEVKPASLRLRVLAFGADLGLWSAIAVVVLCVPGLALLPYLPMVTESQQTGTSLSFSDALAFLSLALLFVGLVGLLCVAFDVYCYLFEHRYGATLGKGI